MGVVRVKLVENQQEKWNNHVVYYCWCETNRDIFGVALYQSHPSRGRAICAGEGASRARAGPYDRPPAG